MPRVQVSVLSTIGTVAVLLLLAHQPSAGQDQPQGGSIPKTFNFADYIEKYKKTYDELETVDRAKLFYARTLGIFKTNVLYATHKIDYYLNQNQYTDLSPVEMREVMADPNSDLKPVEEAKMSPETPADMFVINEQGTPSNEIFEHMTQSAGIPVPSPPKTINFFSATEDEDVDFKELLHELRQNEKLANDMSKVIEIKEKLAEERRLDEVRKANNVVFNPNIQSTNKNFDPSLIQTQSWTDNSETFSRRFAESLMDEFAGSLMPYPKPVAPTRRVLRPSETYGQDTKSVPSSGGYLSKFMKSITEIKDFISDFSSDEYDFDDDEDDEDDEDELVQAQTVAPPSKRKQSEIVYDVDWRKTGCISAVKSQGHCNSCATFASLDLLEFLYCRQMKTSTEFSTQFVIDCGHKVGLRGCQGGKLSNVGMFIKKNGLQLNSVYPYQAREQECPYDETDKDKSYMLKPDLTGWRLFPQISAWYKWIPKSPLIVGISMPADFLGYSGGIHDGNNCVNDMVHAMLLVGSGKQDGKPFWLLKNSFAETWGEAGYFRLSKKAPIKCFNAAVVALARFKHDS